MQKLLLLVAVVGCVDATEPRTGGLEQGLTFFHATPDQGVAGMYAEGDLAVFFETKRVAEPDPAISHQQFAIDGSAIDVSARFTDMEGRNLLVALAQHEAPTEWILPGEPSEAMRAVRPALFDLATKAGAAIQTAQLDAAVAEEVHTLTVTSINLRPPSVTPPGRVGETAYSDGWDHWQYFEVHSASCCGIAEHSASVFWNWSESAGWEDGWQTNNHGRWALEMGLEGDCGGTGAWGGGGRPHYSGGNLQYCDMQNGYSVCGAFGGNHNCHDDTKMQRANIVYGQWFGSAPGWCSGWGCDVYAPHCY